MLSKLAGKMHHGVPVKERVAMAIYRLKLQKTRMEGASMRMHQHDRDVFEKCVKAQMSKDPGRASLYANECAEIRKIAKVTLQCQLALEQITLRLETIQEFGDVAALMAPVTGVVASIKEQITGIMPQVGYELGEIGETLNSVVMAVGEATAPAFDLEASNGEAQRIIKEASSIAEQRIKEKFPDLPLTAIQTPSPTREFT